MKNFKVIAMALVACFTLMSCGGPVKQYEKATKKYEKTMDKLDKKYEKALKASKKDEVKGLKLMAKYKYEAAIAEIEYEAATTAAKFKFFDVKMNKKDMKASRKELYKVKSDSKDKYEEWKEQISKVKAAHDTWRENHTEKLMKIVKKYAEED